MEGRGRQGGTRRGPGPSLEQHPWLLIELLLPPFEDPVTFSSLLLVVAYGTVQTEEGLWRMGALDQQWGVEFLQYVLSFAAVAGGAAGVAAAAVASFVSAVGVVSDRVASDRVASVLNR